MNSQNPDWFAIRTLYEFSENTIKSICKQSGVSEYALNKRRKNEGWQRHKDAHARTIAQLKAIAKSHIAALADRQTIGDRSEQDARILRSLVKTLEDIDLFESRLQEQQTRQMNEEKHLGNALRQELAKRIDALRKTNDRYS